MGRIARGTKSIIDIIRWRAEKQSNKLAYQFNDYSCPSEVEENVLSYAELDRKSRHIAALLQDLNVYGKPVLIMYPPGLDYIVAYFGCLFAGAIAVPCYSPLNSSMMSTLNKVVKNSGSCHVLTIEEIKDKVWKKIDNQPYLSSLQWISTDKITVDMSSNYKNVDIKEDDLAFLQYTSGSTSAPKGVMVTHGNLLLNSEYIYNGFKINSESRTVSWLPPYHDMGLIGGIIQPLYGGFPVLIMSPISFIRRPVRWLQAITKFRATISGGPNFAYDLCVKKITQEDKSNLDLSNWSLAFNGAEPIRIKTLERFSEFFASCGFTYKSFCPCYGLAESTLMVTVADKEDEPSTMKLDNKSITQGIVKSCNTDDGIILVGCGKVKKDTQVVIVNSDTNDICGEDHIGEIWVKGASVAKGYWNNEEATEETFRSLLNNGEGPFLKTGDLGFMHDGELYISGRIKDLIIIRGNNYYPQDIEAIVENSDPGFRQGRIAAFSIEVKDEEQLIIVAENNLSEFKKEEGKNIEELFLSIARAISDKFQISVSSILIVKTSTIPLTTSGKIQRRATRQMYLNGLLKSLAEWNSGCNTRTMIKSKGVRD